MSGVLVSETQNGRETGTAMNADFFFFHFHWPINRTTGAPNHGHALTRHEKSREAKEGERMFVTPKNTWEGKNGILVPRYLWTG